MNKAAFEISSGDRRHRKTGLSRATAVSQARRAGLHAPRPQALASITRTMGLGSSGAMRRSHDILSAVTALDYQ